MRIFFGLIVACVFGNVAIAQEAVNIQRDVMAVSVPTTDGLVEISRIQDNANLIDGDWARTSRPCPAFCIQPMSPAEGVTTIGELEILDMLQDPEAIIVDSRTSNWFYGGTIPGAVTIPFNEAADRLNELGCDIDFDSWDCQNAKPVALFCNGMWCGQSPTAIRAMIEAGYPAEKIYYYRGGMQVWQMLGLTVVAGK